MDALLPLPLLGTFLLASLLITLAPGPDNLLVLSLGMAHGPRQGIAFGLGCALGCLNHTLLATLGIGALILASEPAFNALRLTGGLYLSWLGIQTLRQTTPAWQATSNPPASGCQLFWRGLLANALNPKVALFFVAFLPQFLPAHSLSNRMALLQLGLLFTAQAALVFTVIGYFAGHLGHYLARQPQFGRWLERSAGGVLLFLGLHLLAGK